MNKKATFITRVALAIGTFISLFFVPWLLVWAWLLPLPGSVQAQVNEAISHGLDGMIVYVDEKGKAPRLYASGWHDRKNNIPADPSALFKLASIGKLYDAVVIAKLVNARLLSLDGTVAEYFPELVGTIANASTITLKMLVQHRSGIPNYTNAPNYWANPAHTYEEALALIAGLPANFAPNSDYEYSNSNYLLISKLIEKTTGHTKFEQIREVILQPLKLTHTFGSMGDIAMDKLMGGYHLGLEDNMKSNEYGSMISTAEDVAIFVRALKDGSLFDEGGQEIYASIYEYEHGGWIPGYQSHVKYYEDIDCVIVQFNNTTDNKLYYWNLSEIIFNRIYQIVSGAKSSKL
jgi:D-alanyl-D-alanine carboxypeptidase